MTIKQLIIDYTCGASNSCWEPGRYVITCLLELGCPSVRSLIEFKQRKFFRGIWSDRRDMLDDHLSHTLCIILNIDTQTPKYIRDMISNDVDDV